MTNTKLTITSDQLYALSTAIDIALDDIYHIQKNANDKYCADTAKHLETLSAILGEKILALNS